MAESNRSKRILVVDNNPAMLETMAAFLKAEGHGVGLAHNAFEALTAARKTVPDVIFIDQLMPRISGEDLCRILGDLPELAHSLIVLISDVVLEQEAEVDALAAHACIAKGPFEAMKPLLREVMESAGPADSAPAASRVKGTRNLHARDVTRKLLSRNRHLKIILESMSQGVLEIEENRVVYFNRAVHEFLKIPKDILLGSYFHQCLDASLWEKIEPILGGCHTLPGPGGEAAVVIFDRHFLVQCLPVTGGGDHRILLFTDITEAKQMESAMEAANLSENLGYVFSGVRHEIGNPVGSIKMALGALKRKLDRCDRETIARSVDRSLDEVGRMEYLLRELKNYSLFENPHMRRVSMAEFMANFTALIQPDFEKNRVALESRVDHGAGAARVDDRALHHIMLNLVTNAADACEDIESPRVLIRVTRQSPWVRIQVRDNGSGISEAVRKHLFKPFFTSKPRGTGLGLVIVKKMLMKMGGHITLHSREGQGTTVTLSLPEALNP